ncbi:hypothetical protein PR048_025618 [Dryococelus australis]|uniref:Uncharacterized protein n=1 Tax=Dryococelus australis TaxID=614101 RepID=A0ABQ9GRU9_9NEOP|nr:hypothetical protein PR048_025618 [Dryococelus australis]
MERWSNGAMEQWMNGEMDRWIDGLISNGSMGRVIRVIGVILGLGICGSNITIDLIGWANYRSSIGIATQDGAGKEEEGAVSEAAGRRSRPAEAMTASEKSVSAGSSSPHSGDSFSVLPDVQFTLAMMECTSLIPPPPPPQAQPRLLPLHSQPPRMAREGGSDVMEVGPLPSHQGDPSSIPGGVALGFAVRCRWSACFLWDLPFPLPPLFNSGGASYVPRFTRISSQDLDVKSRPNKFTRSRESTNINKSREKNLTKQVLSAAVPRTWGSKQMLKMAMCRVCSSEVYLQPRSSCRLPVRLKLLAVVQEHSATA